MRLLYILLLDSALTFAEDANETSNFFDPEDGQFDVGGHLSSAYGFLPKKLLGAP